MRRLHPSKFAENQLPILLDLCERAVDLNEPTQCPLCEKILPLASLRDQEDLQGHLAWHLEQIALFALPMDDFEADDTNDGNTNQAIPENTSTGHSDDSQSMESLQWSGPDSENALDDYGLAPSGRSAVLELLKHDHGPTHDTIRSQVGDWCENSTWEEATPVHESENVSLVSSQSQKESPETQTVPLKSMEKDYDTPELGRAISPTSIQSDQTPASEPNGPNKNETKQQGSGLFSNMYNKLLGHPDSYVKKYAEPLELLITAYDIDYLADLSTNLVALLEAMNMRLSGKHETLFWVPLQSI